MAPPLLVDLSHMDLSKVQMDVAAIEAVNPHRDPMRLIDAVVHIDDALTEAVALKGIRDDEFWVPGHIPGRPLFPGVLMIEASAQLASLLSVLRARRDKVDQRFLGFVGADDVKFRGQVVPGDRLVLLGKMVEARRRRFICDCQAVLKGTLVFEARITGMPM